MKTPYIVNFFTQREYKNIPAMIKAGVSQVATDPKSYGSRKR